jgi:hypothetical protein
MEGIPVAQQPTPIDHFLHKKERQIVKHLILQKYLEGK